MIDSYERLYVNAFSKKTLFAFVYVAICNYLLEVLIYTLGGNVSWFMSFRFLLFSIIRAIPLMIVLLLRLRSIADPEKNNVRSIVNKETFLNLAAWINCGLFFMWCYFSTFSQPYLKVFSYPEGYCCFSFLLNNIFRKYGPPLLREQPFFIISWAIFLSIVAYFRMIYKYRSVLIYHVDEKKPTFCSLINERFFGIISRIVDIIGTAMLLVTVENLIFRPHSYVLSSQIIAFYRPIRRPVYSFWEFTDPSLIYQFIVSAAILLLLHNAIEIIVEVLFGAPFFLARGKDDANIILLSGLRNSRKAVRKQATIEIRHVILYEDKWRESLFKDFINDEALSRILCLLFCEQIESFSRHLNDLVLDMKRFSEIFEKRAIGISASKNSPFEVAEEGIFSPRNKTLIERLVDPLVGSSKQIEQAPIPCGSVLKKRSMPEILEVRSAKKSAESILSSSSTPRYQWKSRNLRIICALFSGFAGSQSGQSYAALSCEVIKSWWLGHEEETLWLIDCLNGLLVASYDEDTHGQVQFVMDQALATLCDLFLTIEKFEDLPSINGVPLSRTVYGNVLSPSNARCRRVGTLTIGAIEAIMETFADSINEVKLRQETREKLKKLGFTF